MSIHLKNPRETQKDTIRAIPAGAQIIKAHHLELKTPLGCPYTGVELTVKQGEVFAICGRSGSGKTALLLTLAGRMKFTKGELSVFGYSLPQGRLKVQKHIDLSIFDGLNNLLEAQRVRQAVSAKFELHKRTLTKQDIANYLDEWSLNSVADKRMRDLTHNELVHLGIALAWVNHPNVIAVNDIENQLTKEQSIANMNDLLTLAHKRKVTILVGLLERDLARMADNALYL